MPQEPTVLMRVWGTTKKKLDQLRTDGNDSIYSYWRPKETYAQIIDRIADAALTRKKKPEKKPAGKARGARRRHKVVNRRRSAKVVNRRRGRRRKKTAA